MQAAELLTFPPPPSSAIATVYDKDSGANMNQLGVSANSSEAEQMETELESLDLKGKLQLDDGDDQEDEKEDEEFSFVCTNPDGFPISAEDAFYNGQIRPVYPLFNRDLLFMEEEENLDMIRPPLRKVFVEKRDTLAPESELEEGTYCEWSPLTAELGKKSNSTGFSKLWRFRDLMMMHRSSSDGKDAFVFLNNNPTGNDNGNGKSNPKNKVEADSRTVGPKLNRVKPQSVSSAHETHYVRSRAQKQVDKRKSYLPYRQDLLSGFFTNVNGLTKNVHPF